MSSYQVLLGDIFFRILIFFLGRNEYLIVYSLGILILIFAIDTYKAASYVWGSAEDKVEIIHNGVPSFVIENLADASKTF